jgi:hypothetical protein
MLNEHPCKHCGGPKVAHFEPDKTWPDGVCLCGMPDGPCGCPGFEPKDKTVPPEAAWLP